MKCGIILDNEQIALAIVNDNGEFIFSKTQTPCDSYPALLTQIADNLNSASPARFESIGISINGLYLHQEGRIFAPQMPLIDNKPLKHDLQAYFACPVSIASHGQTLCAGQLDTHKDCTIFALYLDENVSAGLAIDGKLSVGRNGLAGNWGHISLPWPVDFEMDGQICWCGKTGCLAHFVSCSGVEADFERLTSSTASIDEIIQRSLNGDFVAESALQVLEDRIARGLALICNLLDPDIIVMGGYLARLDRIYQHIPRKWPGYSTGTPLKTPLIRIDDDRQCRLSGATRLGQYFNN